jgi:hypothetical protein
MTDVLINGYNHATMCTISKRHTEPHKYISFVNVFGSTGVLNSGPHTCKHSITWATPPVLLLLLLLLAPVLLLLLLLLLLAPVLFALTYFSDMA